MPEQGKLVLVQAGNQQRLRLAAKGKQYDFKYAELSAPLQTVPQDQLNGREVEFSRNRHGAVVRIAEPGVSWQDPAAQDPADPTSRVTSTRPRFRIDGDDVPNNQIDICERDTALHAPVERPGTKWRRGDYYCENRKCYPYNFVRAPRSVPFVPVPKAQRRPAQNRNALRGFFAEDPHLDHGRFAPETHTGVIEVELTALSPLIVSHPPGSDSLLSQQERGAMNAVYQQAQSNTAFGPTQIEGQPGKPKPTRDEKMQRIRPPFQTAPDRYVLPATSLKGMLRSMVEAYSNSLMGVVSKSLNGLEDEGAARIRSRTDSRWSRPGTGITRKNDVTVYTYKWIGSTWQRWVGRGHAPYDKLAYLNPAANPLNLTLADAMFGRVFEKDNSQASAVPALRGRIRISDGIAWDAEGKATARAAGTYWFLRTLTRPSGAKAKCEALYLLPDANGNVAKYGDPKSQPRGRKGYWPHSLGGPGQEGAQSLAWACERIRTAASREALWADNEFTAAVAAFKERVTGHRDSQAATKSWGKPLLPGSSFRFSIRFEQLTSQELGALLKALELNNSEGKPATHCHRLGRAKPLGFGA
ncbi:MAG: hypothetical protein KJ052_04130, partial [Candidatus Hydrogenedentes bacterium]|nr:hypothetical protein [Candidatus Hydrogenedentota bacterium]